MSKEGGAKSIQAPHSSVVLHHLGAADDRGGIVAVVRALAAAGRFECVLGVNPGYSQRCVPPLETIQLPALAGDGIGLANFWRARATAKAVRAWLRSDCWRDYHARSRTGLLVAWWLHGMGETRFVASVQWFGRQRWFYRLLHRQLGERLFWLGPAMKQHYGVGASDWSRCIPDCVVLPPGGFPVRSVAKDPVFRVGCLGGLARIKEWEIALRALARVSLPSRIRLRHAGGEDGTVESAAYASELRALAVGLGVAPEVEWCGQVGDVAAFLAETDCLLVASRWEASSVAALEALVRGVPVLAADSAGTRDLIEETGGGGLFRAGDPDDLARKLEDLARGRLPLQLALPEKLLRFSVGVVAAQWVDVYRGVLSNE